MLPALLARSAGLGMVGGLAQFRALFTQPAVLALRLFPGDAAITVMDLDAYVAAQVTAAMKAVGYEERPVDAAYVQTGDICEARVRFQMVFAADRVHDALDVFQLVRLDDQWRIASIISEVLGAAPPAEARS